MDLYDALLGRRTVFHFDAARDVPREAIERALEAGRWAPNHKLTEPWRFTVAGRKTIEAIARANGQITAELADPGFDAAALAAKVAKAESKIATLPALIVVSYRASPDDAFRDREDYAATCCALHNISLSLWAEGIGAQWGTGAITRDPRTYDVLGIDREREVIIGFLKVGYAAQVPAGKRRPVGELTRWLP